MKKTLILFLVAASLIIPTTIDIDAYREYNAKLLVMDDSINTFNIESFYKIEC